MVKTRDWADKLEHGYVNLTRFNSHLVIFHFAHTLGQLPMATCPTGTGFLSLKDVGQKKIMNNEKGCGRNGDCK